MKRILVCSLFLAVTSTLLAQKPAATSQPATTTGEKKELTQQQLLDRIEQLEARVRELESRLLEGPTASVSPKVVVPKGTKTTPWNVIPPQPRQQVRSVPEHWTPQEFNGSTYYLIPLSSRKVISEN